jgi:phage tail-like protein
MAVSREDPYGSFNFSVTIKPKVGPDINGAFSDVSGLNGEVTHADYRVGNSPDNHVRKIPLMHKAGDVTFKRGLMGGLDLFQWIAVAKGGNHDAKAASIVIKLMGEDGHGPVATWTLKNARPQKWTGPTLAAKGATDVAMEELVVVCEDITYS